MVLVVPQGSALGSFLFLLYTSERFSFLDNILYRYTDDSTLVSVVPSPLLIITKINMTIIIYIYFFSMCGSACGCVRQYEYRTTFPHLLPSMYDFMID